MKYRIFAMALASLLVLLTAGCGDNSAPSNSDFASAPQEDTLNAPLKVGTIVRHPESGTTFMKEWQDSRGVADLLTPDELGTVDWRCADLWDANLSNKAEMVRNASFDDETKWPEDIPADVELDKLLELGKDPGLGVRELHAQGITGKGVGIAIIDQCLLVEHQEYADRVRLYEEYHTMAGDVASMHGAAVASIALGETVGVAPEALLYYIADDVGVGNEESFTRDMTFYAQDVDRFIALNETLPTDEKIRIISMSAGYMKDDLGAAEMDAAIGRARDAGIAIMMMNSRDPLMDAFTGMNRVADGDPNERSSYLPGLYLEEYLYAGEYSGVDSILVPMDRRTTAAQTNPDGYAYYPSGGSSWKAPYVAGLYALACQVKPDVTFEQFVDAARETAHPASIEHEGKDYPYGNIVDPAALLEQLKNA